MLEVFFPECYGIVGQPVVADAVDVFAGQADVVVGEVSVIGGELESISIVINIKSVLYVILKFAVSMKT